MSFTFDTLEYAKTLREGEGAVSAQQAEKMAEALKGALSGSGGVATKGDIENLRLAVKADIDSFRAAIKSDIDSLRASTKSEIDSLRASTKSEIDSLRTNIDSLRASTKSDIDSLRKSTKSDIDGVQRELTFHRWAFGVILALQFAILARLLMQ